MLSFEYFVIRIATWMLTVDLSESRRDDRKAVFLRFHAGTVRLWLLFGAKRAQI